MRKLVILAALAAVLYCPATGRFVEQGPAPPPLLPKPVKVVSRGDQAITMIMEATAYNWSGQKTYTGTWPKSKRTVAVDPQIIPLGSRVYVEGIGWLVAEDTGSAIKGLKIDIFMATEQEAIKFGRKKVLVKVKQRR